MSELPDPADPADDETLDRRRLLTRVGGLVAGAAVAAAAGGSTPAAANDPDDLTLGQAKTTGSLTRANYTGSTGGAAFVFQAGDQFDGATSDPEYKAALAGWAAGGNNLAGISTGVYAYSSWYNGRALFALAESGTAVHAKIVAGSGVAVQADAHDSAAVQANSSNGDGIQVNAALSGARLFSHSGQPLVLLRAAVPQAMPPTTGVWEAGTLSRAADDSLWYCTLSGNGLDSRWVRLSGGGLNLLDSPMRAYDSRPQAGGPGPFVAATTRTISLAGIGVPYGAAGALCNITLSNTVGVGYVKVYSAAVAEPATSNLNWYEDNQMVANNATTRLDSNLRINVTTAGGSTHLIVDVTGFYF